jgi:glucose/arabinose dehydrogenase
MKKILSVTIIFLLGTAVKAQTFTRSELSTTLTTPWEMTYGPDGFLWITEAEGIVSRVDPNTGAKTLVFNADDYCNGYACETCTACFQPSIGVGTLGLALHPDFLNPATSYIYFVYSYNSTNTVSPSTKFKIKRLLWSAGSNSVIAQTDLITGIPTGFDHLGGRLMAVRQNGNDYLYLTVGDNGVSETNSPNCYNPQSCNPNNMTQDTSCNSGKIHRFNVDGSIPADNPMPGKSFFTRGHRNPQGLVFNPALNIMYGIEHGDRTDDEINVLEGGKNYGWKNVRGYHSDNNYPGEAQYISSYTLNPGITNDGLKEPMWAWCATPQPTSNNNADWCTVAPSDGIYYSSTGIPGWDNSLLIVTLKNGVYTDQEMYKFKLNPDGITLAPPQNQHPNPEKFFGVDQALNGRLRDIAVSPDGKKIYLINNGGADRDKITVYTYNDMVGLNSNKKENPELQFYPNPSGNVLNISCGAHIEWLEIYDSFGKLVSQQQNSLSADVSELNPGIYTVRACTSGQENLCKKFVKE